MQQVLTDIVQNGRLHARWLNTLSYMENAGARKISACEHPATVELIQLKHAAEEHRHAYYLKKQIQKLGITGCTNYLPEALLAATQTFRYLHTLDIRCCRYFKQQFHLSGQALKQAAYLFVTYAIELRADELYPQYQAVLTAQQSPVTVKSIIAEEEGHLEEMTAQLQQFDNDWQIYAAAICRIETELYHNWLAAIDQEITSTITI